MHFEVQDGPMTPRTVGMLRHGEAAREICFESHRYRRLRSHLAFDVVAMQMERYGPVARPSQLYVIALADANGVARGDHPSLYQRELEDLPRWLWCRGAGRYGQRRDDTYRIDEDSSQRWSTWMFPPAILPPAL